MGIDSRKIKGLFSAWAACAALSIAMAQDPSMPPQGGNDPGTNTSAPANAAPTPAAPGTSTTPGATPGSAAAADYLFNKSPQEGSAGAEAADVSKMMKQRAIAQDALGLGQIPDEQLRARFMMFLGTPEVTMDRLNSYNVLFEKTRTLLRDRRLMEAWRELHTMAEFEDVDAGMSRELANRIENIWGVNRNTDAVALQNQKLEEQAKQTARGVDRLSERARAEDVKYNRLMNPSGREKGAPNGGVPSAAPSAPDMSSAPNMQNLLGKMQLTDEYLRGMELKAKMKMNEMQAQKTFEKAKADFGEYISTLYKGGRFRHVILASEFYLRLFDQTDYPVAVGQQVNAALESAREVQSAIEVFNYKLERRDLVAASQRLQEAFLLSEYHPALLSLPRVKKDEVEDLNNRIAKLQNMLEAKDFGALESGLAELKGRAADFDATKPMAIVNGIKLEARLRLAKAKIAGQQGKLDEAMAEFQKAAEVWPGNPELERSAQTFITANDAGNQQLVEFDRLVADGNIRGVFEKQHAFAPAIKDDPKRVEQFKDALEKVKVAEVALEKAATFRNNGDVFGAWETVELAVQMFPNDNKLNILRGELAGRGAEFVAALNKAKEAEARSEWGYGLSCYAVAQRYYPASQIANQAIERLSKQILDSAL